MCTKQTILHRCIGSQDRVVISFMFLDLVYCLHNFAIRLGMLFLDIQYTLLAAGAASNNEFP